MAAITLLGGAGCRGRAQQDVYHQKLVQEVRLLEDELYQADYENRVLLDKLEQAKRQVAECELEVGSGVKQDARPRLFAPRDNFEEDAFVPPRPKPFTDDDRRRDPLDDPPQIESLEDKGDAQTGRASSDEPADDDPLEIPDIDDLVDPGTLVPSGSSSTLPPPRSSTSPNPFPEPLPPSEPIPPGGREFQFEPIEKGDVPVPPRSPNGQPDSVPGKITLPLGMLGRSGTLASSSTRLVLRPTQMTIDVARTQTRYAESDPQAEPTEPKPSNEAERSTGVDLHFRFIDQHGRPISLQAKSVDPLAGLSNSVEKQVKADDDAGSTRQLQIAIFDPEKPESERRLGQWVFGPEQIAKMQAIANDTDTPKELTVPIRWQKVKPSSNRVVVLAKLTSRNTDLRCDADIPLKASPTSIGWRSRSSVQR